MLDSVDGDGSAVIVDLVDYAVVRSSGRPETFELTGERFADTMGVVCQGAVDQGQGGVNDLVGEPVEMAACLRGG